MPYKYAPGEAGKIVLTRQGAGCGGAIFFAAGLIFFVVGIWMFYLPSGSEMPLSLLRYVFAGAGIVAMYLGAVLPKITQRRTPDSIVFDNANGRVQVNQTKSEVDTAYIYYDEIEGFIIKLKSRSDSRGA